MGTKRNTGKGLMKPPKDDRPDREGKRLLATHVDESVHRAFKTLAAEEGATGTAMMHEAIGHLLVAHGRAMPPMIRDHLKANGRPIPRPSRAPSNG